MNAKPQKHLCKYFLGGVFASLFGLFSISTANAQLIYSTDFLSIGVGDSVDPSIPYNITQGTFTTGDAQGYDDEIHEGYASFSTSVISGKASSLSFTVVSALDWNLSAPATLNLYLYTSSTAPTADAASFANMVSGTLIGTYTIPAGGNTGVNSLQLNSAGVLAFNDAVSDNESFAITSQLVPSVGDAGGGLFRDPTYVYLQATPTSVPEPSTWALLLGSLGLLASWRCRSCRKLS